MSEIYEDRLNQALLPEILERNTIANMDIGDGAYVVAWTMYVDGERRCWLLPNMTPDKEPRGTVDTWIERHEEGWHVWVNGGYRWTPGNAGVVTSYENLLPVVKLHIVGKVEDGRL